MKFLDLFAGVGGIRLGMEQAGHECVGFCEIDKFARQSYKAIHNIEGETEYHDITKVTDEQWSQFRGTVDVICGGFPCQSFSLAGKRQGFLDETRGTLFFEIARAAKQIKPRILFLENVKGLLSHDKGRTFGIILDTLDELGYDAEWQVLNSKNFGVPQNRERVIIIGHLRGRSTREVFPISRENGETASSNEIKVIGNTSETGYGSHDMLDSTGISTTLMSRDYKGPKQVAIKQIGNISGGKSFGGNPQTGRVYDPAGISPILSTMQGGGLEPKIAIREATKIGYDVAKLGDSINFAQPNSKTRRGRVGHGVANTLTTTVEQATLTDDFKIRKLTPKECWRLQGFPDWAFNKAQEVNSNSQLYKQAGNSVTVPVIKAIAEKLSGEDEK